MCSFYDSRQDSCHKNQDHAKHHNNDFLASNVGWLASTSQRSVVYSYPDAGATAKLRESCRKNDQIRVQELLLRSNKSDGLWTLALQDVVANNHIDTHAVSLG